MGINVLGSRLGHYLPIMDTCSAIILILLPPANEVAGVCLFTGAGGTYPPGVDTWDSTEYGWQAGGTHPTGMSCYRLQMKLWEGNVFTRVCLFTGKGAGSAIPPEDHTSPGTTKAGVTHPTGMLSC